MKTLLGFGRGAGHRSSISTRKGGGYYDYKLHAAVCVTTGLPVAWHVDSAATAEVKIASDLLDAVGRFQTGVATLDKGYEQTRIYEACETRGIRPVIPLRKTPAVKAGKHRPPSCEHGE